MRSPAIKLEDWGWFEVQPVAGPVKRLPVCETWSSMQDFLAECKAQGLAYDLACVEWTAAQGVVCANAAEAIQFMQAVNAKYKEFQARVRPFVASPASTGSTPSH
jgi:hypothetical protein